MSTNFRLAERKLLNDIRLTVLEQLKSFTFSPLTATTMYSIQRVLDCAIGAHKNRPVEHHVVCDESNNPPDVVDSNRLVVDVFVKPFPTSNNVQLQLSTGPMEPSPDILPSPIVWKEFPDPDMWP